jgi:hypothetical protein
MVLAAQRAQQLVQLVVMAPFALVAGVYNGWQNLFKSQRCVIMTWSATAQCVA